MNSLEFIEKEIEAVEKELAEIVDITNDYLEIPDTYENKYNLIDDANERYSNYSLRLNQLLQIKFELEAWKELNELFIIKPYYQDKENNKHPAIMIQHKIEKDFEYVRRGCEQKSFDTIKKALEVEDGK